MQQVLVKPLWEMGLGNRLWQNCYPGPFTAWREAARELGILLDTWDVKPLASADCVWVMDLPNTRREMEQARRQARPGVPFVLQVMESPLRCENFVPVNREGFDFVVTYEQSITQPQTFSYRLPNYLQIPNNPLSFENRACAVMVNSNQRFRGWLAPRQRGLCGLPGVGMFFSGWELPPNYLLGPDKGELYSWRRTLARTAEALDSRLLVIHGRGWHGEKSSWCPFVDRKPFKCAVHRGWNDTAKALLIRPYKFCISTENFRGRHDYVSEKIFDALLNGVVPVYLGDENIQQLVPSRAFVDVRNFRSPNELWRYLRDCPKREWEGMLSAGRAFLESPACRSFDVTNFVQTMNRILLMALGRSGSSPVASPGAAAEPGTRDRQPMGECPRT